MSSNGGSASGNFSDNSRSTSNRYRSGSRRGRGRGNNERMENPNPKDRRSSQSWRVGGKQNMNEQIDLADSSQWPSIQEISKSETRGRHSVSQLTEKNTEQQINHEYARLYKEAQPQVEDNYENADNQKPITLQRTNSQFSTGNAPNNNYGQYNNNSYGIRQGGNDRYISQNINRGRGRYNNYSGSRYQSGYSRRYSKGYTSTLPSGVVIHPEVAPFFVPQVFESNQNYSEKPAFSNNELGSIKQVEYYFSRSNLIRDTFIRSHMDKEGWVSLKEIYNFKRIQVMNLLFEEFVKILTSSELLEIDTKDYKVRTKVDPQQWVIKEELRTYEEPITNSLKPDQNINTSYASTSSHHMQPVYTMPSYGYQTPFNYYHPGNMQNNFRQMQSYQIYSQPVYGIPFNEMSQEFGGYYQYGQEYYNGYQPYPAMAYNTQSSIENNDQTGQNQSSQKIETVSEEQLPLNSTTNNEEEIEELSRKVSNIDVSNPPVSC